MEDKRQKQPAVPENYLDYLNEEQLPALRRIEGFGWHIKFIRRPLFQDPITVVESPDGREIGVLEEDGRINLEHDLIIRD